MIPKMLPCNNLRVMEYFFTDTNGCSLDCGQFANCTASDGVETCNCNAGYTGNGTNCKGKLYIVHMADSNSALEHHLVLGNSSKATSF